MLLLTSAVLGAERPALSIAPLLEARLTDIDGRPVTLAGMVGRPAVVAFWARWCAPCRDEIPVLEAARALYAERGVAIVAVAVEDNVEAVREFAAAYKIGYRVVVTGPDGTRLLQALGNPEADLPFTLVLDETGAILAERRGRLRMDDIAAALNLRPRPAAASGQAIVASGSAP